MQEHTRTRLKYCEKISKMQEHKRTRLKYCEKISKSIRSARGRKRRLTGANEYIQKHTRTEEQKDENTRGPEYKKSIIYKKERTQNARAQENTGT